jgi:hypothetical protein
VGINTAILAPNGGNVGIGFAIPVNMAMSIMNTLVEHGEVKRGLLGVTVQDLTHELAQAFKLTQTQGAVITGVQPGSPAERADLEPGDVVLSINGRRVKNSADVRNIIGLAQIGDVAEVEVIHKGATVMREAKIAKPQFLSADGQAIHPRLAGVLFKDVAGGDGGVLIEKMSTASYAYQAGLAPGDIAKTEVPKIPVRLELLSKGNVQAASLPEPLASLGVVDGARIVVDDRSHTEYGQSIVTFSTRALARKPAALKRLLSAYERAVSAINTEPEKYRSLLIDKGRVPKPVQDSFQMPVFPQVGVPAQSEVGDVLQWMKGKGLLSKDLSYDQLVTDSYLPKRG